LLPLKGIAATMKNEGVMTMATDVEAW